MKWLNYLFLIFLIILLAGCWDRKELGDVSIVTGMAVDKGENAKYRLTVETTEAREVNYQTASGLAPSFVYSLEGDT